MIGINMNKTRAEEILGSRAELPPEISDHMARSVSEQRREMLERQLEAGQFREKGAGAWSNLNPPDFNKLTTNGFVSHSRNLTKTASSISSSGSSAGDWHGSGGTVRQVPEVYSPLWLNSNLNLPRDRATINAWSRSFYALNPIVQNAISLHSTYPIAKLNIKCKNRKVEQFFSQMIEELDLMNVCAQIAQEFWTLGEAFIYAELDESTAKWSRLLIQNPDYVTVKRSVIAGEPIISLKPDENLRRLVLSNKQSDVQQRKQLDPSIVEHVKKGNNIPLNNFYVSHLARRISPYEIRGTGLIVSCFRSLMLLDKLYESKFAQADSMVNPLTLVKIGSEENRPTPVDLEQWREVFENAMYDKNFKIFTHKDVIVEPIGFGGAIYDISNDVQQLIKNIYIGLMVPSVIMDGSDTTYATGSVALDVLRQRYMQFRNMLAYWLKRKIFAPISKLNDFYDRENGEKKLIIPEVDWNHMSLFDLSDYISNLSSMATGDGPAKKISIQTLYRSLGLEYEDEQRKMRFEDIQDTIRQKEMMALQRYSLNELRAMGPDDEIEEVLEEPVPGESPYEAGGGAEPSGGAPSMGGLLGGPGPMPGGPPPAPIGGGSKPPASSTSSGPKPPPSGGKGAGAPKPPPTAP